MQENFYIILGVGRNATPEQIKEAFRRKAKEYHPDIKGSEYRDIYMNIRAAYETLIDPVKRNKYNKTGFVGFSENELRAKAYNYLRDYLVKLIKEQSTMMFDLDIVDIVIQYCSKQINILKLTIDKSVKYRDYLNKLHRRFKKKNTIGEDMIKLIFVEEVATVNNKINKCLSDIQMLEKVIGVIKMYSLD